MSRHILERDPVRASSAQVRVHAVGSATSPLRRPVAARSAVAAVAVPPRTAQSGLPRSAIDDVWTDYLAAPTRPLRDRLVLHYAKLVHAVAHRVAATLPAHVEVDDLAQSGVFGLIAAIERFDPQRCPRFESYAAQRIRGAILDELRAQDWVPRTVRGRLRDLERAQERLEGSLLRAATDRELTAELGVPAHEVRVHARSAGVASVEAMDGVAGGVAELLADHDADPMVLVQARELSRQLRVAVGRLAERDRVVIGLYYLENRTLAEIGKVLGLTESRVCQLHSRAVARLRGTLEELATG